MGTLFVYTTWGEKSVFLSECFKNVSKTYFGAAGKMS